MSIFKKFQTQANESPVSLGVLARSRYLEDAKLLPIYLSRYKFVIKMVGSNDKVLEIGCADGFAGRIVAQTAKAIDFSDIDDVFLEECRRRNPHSNVFKHDFCKAPVARKYDVIYCLDVIEHILPEITTDFLVNIGKSLNKGGVLIIGTPSLESQKWASEGSKIEHINCRTQESWKITLSKIYLRTFCFSMNDEVLHTGFAAMSHYLFFLNTQFSEQSAMRRR